MNTHRAAVRIPGSRKAVGEDAALEVAPELTLHIGRHALTVLVVSPCERKVALQVLLDDLVKDGLLGMAAAIGDRATSL